MLLRLVRIQRSASNIGIKGNIYHWHSCGIVVVKGAHHIACLRHRVSRRELELVCYGVIIFITFFGTILLPRQSSRETKRLNTAKFTQMRSGYSSL